MQIWVEQCGMLEERQQLPARPLPESADRCRLAWRCPQRGSTGWPCSQQAVGRAPVMQADSAELTARSTARSSRAPRRGQQVQVHRRALPRLAWMPSRICFTVMDGRQPSSSLRIDRHTVPDG